MKSRPCPEAAAVKTEKIEASLAQEYKSAVVKLFEESERPLFLQRRCFGCAR